MKQLPLQQDLMAHLKILYLPISAVEGIYAKENGEGLFFEAKEDQELGTAETKKSPNKPKLTLVKS
jgi:stringent starvation protein B